MALFKILTGHFKPEWRMGDIVEIKGGIVAFGNDFEPIADYGYKLFDSGNGYEGCLEKNSVERLDPKKLEGTNLASGRMSVTAATTRGKSVYLDNCPIGLIKKDRVNISGTPGVDLMLEIELPHFSHPPECIALENRVSRKKLWNKAAAPAMKGNSGLAIGFSDLLPGFYMLRVLFPDGWYYEIKLIKHFPIPLLWTDDEPANS